MVLTIFIWLEIIAFKAHWWEEPGQTVVVAAQNHDNICQKDRGLPDLRWGRGCNFLENTCVFSLSFNCNLRTKFPHYVNRPSLRAIWNLQPCVLSKKRRAASAHFTQLVAWLVIKQRGCVNKLGTWRPCKPKCNLPVKMASIATYLYL